MAVETAMVDERWDTARTEAFSDGVLAIAITLLVLDLNVPSSEFDELWRGIVGEWPAYLAYASSFFTIGAIWLRHHGIFGRLAYVDRRLMTLNLLYLACIALVPFSSGVLGDYSGHTEAVVLYAVNMMAVSGSFYAQVVYSSRAGLLREEAQPYERRNAAPVNLVVVGVFALSIPVAFVSPLAATLMWLTIFFIGRWVTGRATSSPSR